ncbi:MAG: hydroxyacid dehydrogenase, partial [Sedimentisphaerales bacterium]|nr:hydroxyacid dehydrogenase [Sedimentisphaerales bacterium]
MIKILVADPIAKEGIDLLKAAGDVDVTVKTGLSEDELAAQIGQFDGVIVRSESKITPKVLANPGRLQAIARAGVGVDNVDLKEATRKGILVMNTPGGNTRSAAEHTMALILALCRNIVPACNSLKAGKWDRKRYMGNQLYNKVLGIIGLGRIGMGVARMAKGFGMKIMGYDPLAVPTEAAKIGIEVCDSLERIFKEADIITVHVPKNDQTINMIGTEQIAMMKPTVRLINVARGGIINEDALYQALENRRIAGAALDVFTSEPPTDNRFARFDNCIVTPHLGASTEEAQIEVATEAAQILLEALRDKTIRNAVNAPSITTALPGIVVQYGELAL